MMDHAPMTDLTLRSSPASPFGRKVKLAAAACGLTGRIDIVRADTNDPADSLRTQNPLGKIPTLVTADGTVLYDSRVIVEYLDHLAGGGKVIPTEPKARFEALTLQALGDGIMDAAILRRYEATLRGEGERSARWDGHQQGKVDRGLDHLEANLPAAERLTIGEIAVAAALAYLDFRFEGSWRAGHPNLAAWLDTVGPRMPGWAETTPA